MVLSFHAHGETSAFPARQTWITSAHIIPEQNHEVTWVRRDLRRSLVQPPSQSRASSGRVLNNFKRLVWSPLENTWSQLFPRLSKPSFLSLSFSVVCFSPWTILVALRWTAPDCQQVCGTGEPRMGCATPDVAPDVGKMAWQEREEKSLSLASWLHPNTQHLRQQGVNIAEIKFLCGFKTWGAFSPFASGCFYEFASEQAMFFG